MNAYHIYTRVPTQVSHGLSDRFKTHAQCMTSSCACCAIVAMVILLIIAAIYNFTVSRVYPCLHVTSQYYSGEYSVLLPWLH